MLAQRRKIEVHTEIEPDITGYLDESFYIRMLDNLISNAVSYGKEGGNIKVTLHQIPSGVQGTVEDDGIGISRDDQCIYGSGFTGWMPHGLERKKVRTPALDFPW